MIVFIRGVAAFTRRGFARRGVGRVFVVVKLVLLGKIFSVSRITLVSTQGSHLALSIGGNGGSTRATLSLTNGPSGFLSAMRVNVALVNLLANVCSNGEVTSSFSGLLVA